MRRDQGRDPRHLPNPEEMRKTNEPLSEIQETPVKTAPITRQIGESTLRYSTHRQ
jgi:hypothetical protein